jgi:peptidoglycan/xylan/chitin deacetylase (PgdA/CDA1 family)
MQSGNGFPRKKGITMNNGGIVRMDTTKKNIWLCFTADGFADGFDHITNVLADHNVKASFFLTGNFLRTKDFEKIIKRLKADGHYVGAHSDRHLLYCSWENRDSLLVKKKEFLKDLADNYKELEKQGIPKNKALVFLPPYEWYNDSIASWTEEYGLTLVNNSPGTITAQDWTIPDGNKYYSSDVLMQDLLNYEKSKGLNGYILLIHPGTDPKRTDKLYLRLDSILSHLENKGYTFHSFGELN